MDTVSTESLRIFVVDEVGLTRDTLARCLALCGFGSIREFDSADAFVAQVDAGLGLVSATMRAGSGRLAIAEAAARRTPGLRQIALGMGHNPAEVRSSLEAGAALYLDRCTLTLGSLLSSIRGLLAPPEAPEPPVSHVSHAPPPPSNPGALLTLTPREREVFDRLAAGDDNLKIAVTLGISERTVKAHVSALYRKLQVETRVQLAYLGWGAALRESAKPEAGASDRARPAPKPASRA